MKSLIFYMSLILICSCSGTNKTYTNTNLSKSTRPIIIYKTTQDYSNLVPVIMNDDKTEIIAYPAISDIKEKSKPTKLHNGYLLDNIGIGINSVYTSYTIDEYSELDKQPTIKELKHKIIDKSPFLEIYKYNNNFSPTLDVMNNEIEANFKNCTKVY